MFKCMPKRKALQKKNSKKYQLKFEKIVFGIELKSKY